MWRSRTDEFAECRLAHKLEVLDAIAQESFPLQHQQQYAASREARHAFRAALPRDVLVRYDVLRDVRRLIQQTAHQLDYLDEALETLAEADGGHAVRELGVQLQTLRRLVASYEALHDELVADPAAKTDVVGSAVCFDGLGRRSLAQNLKTARRLLVLTAVPARIRAEARLAAVATRATTDVYCFLHTLRWDLKMHHTPLMDVPLQHAIQALEAQLGQQARASALDARLREERAEVRRHPLRVWREPVLVALVVAGITALRDRAHARAIPVGVVQVLAALAASLSRLVACPD